MNIMTRKLIRTRLGVNKVYKKGERCVKVLGLYGAFLEEFSGLSR